MALLPKISFSLENKCDKVDICEETGVYASGNVGGWGAPNINPPVAGFSVCLPAKRSRPGRHRSVWRRFLPWAARRGTGIPPL